MTRSTPAPAPTRAAALWASVRDSLWFVPGLMTLAGAALALALVALDEWLLIANRAPNPAFAGGIDGARGVLGAIAATTIAVVGLVFSITVVALQLASSQFTPRVLRLFLRDPFVKQILGVFIGTFTYTLLVLRSVRGAEEGAGFVPTVAVGGAIVLSLICVGYFIYYLDHATRSLQVARVIDRTRDEAVRGVRELFPDGIGTPVTGPAGRVAVPSTPCATVTALEGGYLQALMPESIFALASRGPLRVQMAPWVGDFVLPGAPLARIWPAEAVDAGVEAAVRDAFLLADDRTLEQDVELGIRQLADIGLRALSPAINDPTTAMLCVDRLGEVLARLARRPLPAPVRADPTGQVLIITRETTFARAVRLAFTQLRHYGAGDPLFAAHLIHTLDQLVALCPESCRSDLDHELAAVRRTAEARLTDPLDLARIRSHR